MIAISRNERPQSHADREPGVCRARRTTACTSHGRNAYARGLLGASALLLCLASCAAQKDLADARLEADECRLELKAMREKLAKLEDKSLLRAQRDRLAAANEHLKRELSEVRERERQLRRNLAIEDQAGPEAGDKTAAQRKELQRALANIRRSRSQWERTLAECQRQIDVLTSQIASLKKELQAARAGSRPATRPR